MSKLLFILNPVAGGGNAKSLIPIIEKGMKIYNIEYEIRLTTEPKEAIKIAEESHHHKIIAVGGDGTVNEVARGLINRGSGVLGIIPGGTGNDMSKTLGIPMDPIQALEYIINGDIKEVDLGMANGRYFLNISSVGFDADVVFVTNKIKMKIKSKVAYILGILTTLIHYRKKDVFLKIDDKSFNTNLVLLAVGNGRYYGGGLMILPMANTYDGYLHVCLAKDINNFKTLLLFPSIFKGNHIKYEKYIEIYKAKKIEVHTKEDVYFNLDGEIISAGKSIVFEIVEDKKLQVIHA